MTTLRDLPGVQVQSQFDHFWLGFLLTVCSLVVDILKHIADSIAQNACCRLMSSRYSYTWEEIRAQLVKLAAYIPPGETLELCVFGGSTVLCWGMQDRLSNDVDVLESMSSPGLLEV